MTARALLLAALLAGGALADAERAQRRGDPAAAAEAYRRARAEGDTSVAVRYNLGTMLLALGRHDEARPHLEAAAADSALRLRAAYNAGYADLAPVAAGRVPDAAERTARLERAVARYRAVLLADSADDDARWNLELAERLLRRESASGGGGGEDDSGGGGGGGGEDEEEAPAGGGSASPRGGDRPISPAQAERILGAAEQRDLAVQRERLKQDPRRIHGVRDW